MDPHRREFIRRALAASLLIAVGGVSALELFELRLGSGGQSGSVTLLQTTTQQSTGSTQAAQSVPAGYTFVTGVGALAGKTSAYFNHPTGGLSLLLNLGGQWKAFSATCTHAPCTVGYTGSQIQCPCHGGLFNPADGSVISGPPPTRLPEYGVLVQSNNLYVSDALVN
jgi:Rieske Fe-S protein